MRNAHKLLILSTCVWAIGACQQEPADQNLAITNNTAGADIEALPPDESSATPSDELAVGATDNKTGLNEGANSL